MFRSRLTRAVAPVMRPAAAVLVGAAATLGAVAASSAPGAAAATTVSPHSAPPFALVAAVACASKSDCIAVGNATINSTTEATTAGAVYSTNGGKSWKADSVPNGYTGIYGIDCISSSTCFAVGAKASANGGLLETTNANSSSGPTWKVHTLPNANGGTFSSPNAVSCPSSSRCYVVGSSNSGANAALVEASISKSSIKFSVMPTPASGGVTDYPTELYAVSCLSTESCIAVGGDSNDIAGGFRLESGHWELETFSSSLPTLWGADCVAKSDDCYVTAASSLATPPVGAIEETTNGGSSWKKDSIPSSVSGVYAIFCSTTSRCAAVGNTSNGTTAVVTKTTANKFSSATVPSGRGPLYGVTCTSDSDCVAGGTNIAGTQGQTLYTTDFTKWTGETA